MTRANDIGSSPANPVMDLSQNTATGETTSYQACYCGLTIRQAYKIAAMREARFMTDEAAISTCSTIIGIDLSVYNALEHYPMVLGVVAGKIADAMLAEDSEHEAALSERKDG